MDEVTNINDEVAPPEASVSDGRPTLMGTQHGSRLFCAHCGAHNAPGWASCFNCGAGRPAVSNGHRYAAALGAAMVSAVTFLMMWRIAHVPATCVVVTPPPPTVMNVVVTPSVVVTTPVQEPAEQVTVVQQYRGVTITSYTCRTSQCTGTLYSRTINGGNGQVVEYNREVVDGTGPVIVASPDGSDSFVENSQPMLAPTDVVVATTGGASRQ